MAGAVCHQSVDARRDAREDPERTDQFWPGRLPDRLTRQGRDTSRPRSTRPRAIAMSALVIRLRHPEEKKMPRVTINGRETQDFDPQREIIRLKPRSERIVIRAFY